MATAEEIAALRLLIDEQADKLPYSDAVLSDRLDAAASPKLLAADIWLEKASAYASLVSVSESGSSRQLSDLHQHALTMADTFVKSDAAVTAVTTRGTRMHRLTR